MIFFEDTAVEVAVAVCVIFDEVVAKCVAYTLGAEGSFFAKTMSVVHILRVVCGGADYAKFFLASPSDGAAYVHKNATVVSYATAAISYEEIFLRVDIEQNTPSSKFYKLSNHFLAFRLSFFP